MQTSLIYVTASDVGEARTIARQLVEERLIACANIHSQIQSLYWWDDAVQDEPEAAFVAKTRTELVPDVVARVRELHSDSCPCVVSLPISDGNPDYLAWIEAQTRPEAAG